jgi:hypothetical protein
VTLYEQFRRLRDAFVATFEHGRWFVPESDPPALTHDAKRVLFDLRAFCRADQSTFDADARVHALREGRREVLLRIQAYLNLSDVDLMKLRDPDELERKDETHE